MDQIRQSNCVRIQYGGWHLGYFGNAEFIKNKINLIYSLNFKVNLIKKKIIAP